MDIMRKSRKNNVFGVLFGEADVDFGRTNDSTVSVVLEEMAEELGANRPDFIVRWEGVRKFTVT